MWDWTCVPGMSKEANMADLHKASSAGSPTPEEMEQLRARLEEAEQTLDAIRNGLVDAVVASGPQGDQVYTLTGADRIYRVIVETMNEAALTVDLDGAILFCNGQFAGMVRLPMEEVIGQKLTRFVADPQRAGMNRLLKQAQAAPTKRRLVLKANDGTVIHVQLAASPLQVGSGNSICLVVSDLTELEASARSVAVLRKQQQDLEQSEDALRRAGEDLARSNHDLEQFAYVASHDLQEPLRLVMSFLGLLRDRYKSKLDAQAGEYINYAVDGAKRMSALITDLLAYSRVARDQKPAMVNMRESVDQALSMLKGVILESGAKIDIGELPTVTADGGQLSQVFQNLIANAIKFRRAGVAPEISIGSRMDGPQWLLWVADNGIGIDPKQALRVFDLFQRLHTRDEYPGTGIGLAICKKIVERHGGRIWVEPGTEGSIFYFTLPEGSPA